MNIGSASKTTGISAKMIRHYESIGLVPAADRSASGYRDFGPIDIQRLRFIRRARDLGFSLSEIRELLRLWSDRARSSREVKAIALRHVAHLDRRTVQLARMADALRHLALACDGDERPDCPIIDGLRGSERLRDRLSTNADPSVSRAVRRHEGRTATSPPEGED